MHAMPYILELHKLAATATPIVPAKEIGSFFVEGRDIGNICITPRISNISSVRCCP